MRRYVAQDLANLRFAFPDDSQFAGALVATSKELTHALLSPATWGKGLDHDLVGWRRSAFASIEKGEADLRLVFQPRPDGGMNVLMFGKREFPDATSAYYLAARRL